MTKTDETAIRTAIRDGRARRVDAERQRVAALNVSQRDPEPDAYITKLRAKAAKKRDLAARSQAVILSKDATNAARREARKDRRRYIGEARKLEIEADAAWQEQIKAYRQGHAFAETAALARLRGEELEETQTEIAEFARDKHGAVVRSNGLPVLRSEIAVTARRKTGLEWLLSKEKITQNQFDIGNRFAKLCAAADKAAQPGMGETTGGGRASAGHAPAPSQWRLDAMAAHTSAKEHLVFCVGQVEGAELFRLAELVCHHGHSIRDLADGENLETARLETRLVLTLSFLRVWFHLKPADRKPMKRDSEGT